MKLQNKSVVANVPVLSIKNVPLVLWGDIILSSLCIKYSVKILLT